MVGYVDMFMLPVPKKHVKDYCKISQKMGRIMRKLGATEYREFMGTDLRKKGTASFLDSVEVASGQVLVFSVVGFKSKSHRDAVNKKVMADPRVKALIAECTKMPWLDMGGTMYGGFGTIVKA